MWNHDHYLGTCRELGDRRKCVQNGPYPCGLVPQSLPEPKVNDIFRMRYSSHVQLPSLPYVQYMHPDNNQLVNMTGMTGKVSKASLPWRNQTRISETCSNP